MKRGQVESAWMGRAECRNCAIRQNVLFADLEEPDFQLIHLPIDDVRVEAQGILYQAGDPGEAAFTIRSGLVKLVQYLPDGNQRIVRLMRPGAVTGLEILLGRPYEHTAIVVQPALVCRLPREVLDRLNRETPRLHRQIMTKWHESLRQADEWLTELNTGSARRRVARLFLHLMEAARTPCQPEGEAQIRMLSREDVGAILSVTTETASRVIAEFKRLGLVVEEGGTLVSCDTEALARAAAEG